MKEAFDRRDVMRAAHLQAVDRLDHRKNYALSFKKFAERVKTHLIDLLRIGGGCAVDVIEKICLKLDPQTASLGP